MTVVGQDFAVLGLTLVGRRWFNGGVPAIDCSVLVGMS